MQHGSLICVAFWTLREETAAADFILVRLGTMTAKEILEELKVLGSESYKRVIFNHGVQEPCFGVKIGDMQKIAKRIRKDYQLALDLYETGNYDAMYLAGLIASW